ncbi:MAG TPA: hypothetical protein VGM30_14875 [Puia sp.]|jgi:hypothetical protein
MSYELYFYRPKGSNLSERQIWDYLSSNLTPVNESGNQWWFENEDTEVYYSFDHNEPESDSKSIELYESFDDFDNTNFSFNLNFMRPTFFGLEAFQFVGTIMAELDMYVLNPQSNFEIPVKQSKEELFDGWNQTNLRASTDHFKEKEFTYIPPEKSNLAWEYNFNRKKTQDQLGENYFVPKLFFLKTKKENRAITLTTWTEHIPMVIPPADYFLLGRQYKKFFRTVKDQALISRKTLLKHFETYFDDFELKECRIIHPENAGKVKDRFNSIKPDEVLKDFAERVAMGYLYNAKSD